MQQPSLAVNELSEARAVLATLERRERELTAELNDVRAALDLQRHKVEESIRRLPVSPINRLPNEMLLRIFELILRAVDDLDFCVRRKGVLAGVSRRWRNAIWNTPCLWTTIKVSSSWSRALIEAHVTRSSESLLDIEIDSRSRGIITQRELFIPLLDLVATCAERWRSLTVLSDSTFPALLVLGRFNRLSLPSLTSVSIADVPSSPPHQFDLPFLLPKCAPRIEDIYLSGEIRVVMGCEIPSSVKTLALRFYLPFQSDISSTFLLECTHYQRLTSLCLEGVVSIDFGQFPPNSLRFPLLEEFACKIDLSAELMCAIVAPRLKRFHGRWLRSVPSLHDTFAGAIGKFSNVDHLDLYRGFPGHDTASESLCLAFPAVRHLTLSKDHTIAILRSAESSDTVCHWHHLESLTIDGYLEELNLKAFIDELAGCLGRRREAGLSKLRLYFPTPFLAERISFVYERLNDECILECAYDTQYQTLGGDRWQVVVGDDCVFGTDIASMLYADV
ncbi:hypothetical protein M404DRAFT_24291 [Pisolithus tinctorius Marx 270]|uniref:Uncharacterized protein n=1 Tax=Pisolithus tinctorius Marx 270 TaxID=870435 RepID=A0A0C3P2G4_PISTI|nr:hypothetical protein M404DRAFT_24291 [Pisolithus tinctorius Marx 270]